MATIRIHRKNEYINRLRNYRIIVDGNEIGSVENDEIKDFEITAGPHSIIAKIDWCCSTKVTIQLNENQTKTYLLSAFRNANILAYLAFGLLILNLVISRSIYFRYAILALILPFLVFVYYFTIGYKRYLVLKESDS